MIPNRSASIICKKHKLGDERGYFCLKRFFHKKAQIFYKFISFPFKQLPRSKEINIFVTSQTRSEFKIIMKT